jgi:hypothetical protein
MECIGYFVPGSFLSFTLSIMSDLKEPGFKVDHFQTCTALTQTSDVLAGLAEIFEKMPEKEKAAQVKKVSKELTLLTQTNGVFQLNVKNKEGKEAIWV